MAHVTASMQAFLRQQGVAEEVLALFTAEVILANAVEEMESRGLAAALLPPDATVVDQAVRQVSRSSSPVSTMEMDGQQQLGEQLSPAPSRSQSPEAAASDDSDSERASRSASPRAPPSSSSAFPLVEASPLARLTAAPKSVSRVPNPKYTTFQRDESETFRFLSTRLASAMVALHRVTRTGDALVLGQFGVDFLGRENLFTSLEFYLGTDTDEDDEEGEGGGILEVSEAVKKPLWELYDVLRKAYCREQATKFRRALERCFLVYDVKAAKARERGAVGKRGGKGVAGAGKGKKGKKGKGGGG